MQIRKNKIKEIGKVDYKYRFEIETRNCNSKNKVGLILIIIRIFHTFHFILSYVYFIFFNFSGFPDFIPYKRMIFFNSCNPENNYVFFY